MKEAVVSTGRYIFISDQGRVWSSSDEPSIEDLEYAAVGMVIIVRLSDQRYFGPEQKWLPIPARRLQTAVMDRRP